MGILNLFGFILETINKGVSDSLSLFLRLLDTCEYFQKSLLTLHDMEVRLKVPGKGFDNRFLLVFP